VDAEDCAVGAMDKWRSVHATAAASDWVLTDEGELVCPQCVEDAERRDDSHERAAARSRNCDFADNPRHPGRDWT
jgi:hypothetical protein